MTDRPASSTDAAPPPPGQRRRRRRWVTPAIAVAAAIGAVGFFAAGLAARANAPADQTSAGAAPDYGQAPSWQLIDQNGRPTSSRQYAGKVQVVSFLFPYCTSYCPLIARTLGQVADTVSAGPLRDKVQLLTFNVDPAGAGPAVLRKYIAQYGGDRAGAAWTYVTGTPAQIRETVTGGFHVYYNLVSVREEQREVTEQERAAAHAALTDPSPQPYTPPPHEPNPLATEAHVDYDVTHNDYVEIVNPHGEIVAVFDQASALSPQQLLTAIDDALAGRPIPLQQVP